jgi:hypothetical protein
MRSELTVAIGRTAARVAVLEEMPVGTALMTQLIALESAPIDATTAVRVQALWGKVESFAAAKRMLATYDTVYGIRSDLEAADLHEASMLASQEIACATHVAYPSAMTAVTLVDRVADCLPASWEALHRGEISLAHLKAVERATRNCPADVAQAVDLQVIALAVARGWTPGETRKAARRLVIALDPEGATERAKTAKADADVTLYPEDDEVAAVVATGDAELARKVMDAVNDRAEAMSRDGDDRGVGVRRFHALADLILNGDRDAALSATRGETHVRIDLATLLGLNDHPGELIGYGPITADTARRIAANSTLRRLVTDPLTSNTLDLGLRAYRPSAALRRLVEATHPKLHHARLLPSGVHLRDRPST